MKRISIPRYDVLQNVESNMTVNRQTWNDFDTESFVLTADNAEFVSDGVEVGDVVFNSSDSSLWATVVSVDSETQLTLDGGFVTHAVGAPQTRLSRVSIAPADTAFKVVTEDGDTANFWWANYKTVYKVQNATASGYKTAFNRALAGIVDISLVKEGGDEVTGAEITLDKPVNTNEALWIYPQGSEATLSIDEFSSMRFYVNQEGDFDNTPELVVKYKSGVKYVVKDWLLDPQNLDEAKSLLESLEKRFVDAITEASQSPWPDTTVMVEGSYGLDFVQVIPGTGRVELPGDGGIRR